MSAPDPEKQAGSVEEFYRARFANTPHTFVTWLLLAINLVVFAIMAAETRKISAPPNDVLLSFGADFGPLTTHGEWWRMATCMFVHIGLVHLAFNMWVLSDIGPLLERLLGPVGFLVLYLFAGLAGSVASLIWDPLQVSIAALQPAR